MNSKEHNNHWMRATVFALAGLVALTNACVDDDNDAEFDEVFRQSEGDDAIEAPEPPPDPPGPDEGPEDDHTYHGPLTIDPAQLSQLLGQADIANQLQVQSQAIYASPGGADAPEFKVELLTGEPVIFTEQLNGELVGNTANFDFRAVVSEGTLYVRHRSRQFHNIKPNQIVPEAVILQQAQLDIQALGLPLGPGQTLSVDRLMRADSTDPANPKEVAYKVFVKLEIDGHRVEGVRLVLSYFLDGDLHKAAIHWPAIIAGPPPAPPTPVVEAEVFAALAAHPLGAETNPLSADTMFVVDSGQLRHAVVIRGQLAGPSGGGPIGELVVDLP